LTIPAVVRRAHARQVVASALLALALPPVLHLFHADVIVLGVAWLAIAVVLTAGRTLLDRLALAGILLIGLLLSAGLLFSLWPWRLAPVPLGIALLLGITAIIALTRRPLAVRSLPRRVEASDAVVLGSVGLAYWLVTRPLAGLDQLQQLRYSAVTLDRMAHYALFESIQRLGGYDFEHQSAARLSVQTPTEAVYPQGSHFLLGVTNNFLSSATSSPPGPALLDRYFLLVLGVYSLCVGAVVWAARWIAGPEASATGRLAVALLATSFVLFGPTAALVNGADSQLFGMAMLVLVAAVVVRPVDSFPEQVLLASAATIAVFYTYNLYGPLAALAVVVAALAFRLPLIRRWRVTVGIGIPAAVVAVLPSYVATTGNFDIQKQALVAGGHVPMSGLLTPLIAAIAITPILSASARRNRVWRGVAAFLGAVVLVLGLFAFYGSAHSGGSYYYGKLLGAAYLCMVALTGLLGLVLFPRHPPRATAPSTVPAKSDGAPSDPPQVSPGTPGRRRARRRRWPAVVASVVVVAVLLVFSGFQQRLPGTTNGSKTVNYVPLARWSSGVETNVNWSLYAHLAATGELPSSGPMIVLADRSRGQAWGNTFYVAALAGDLGAMQKALAILGGTTPLTPAQSAAGVGKSAKFVAIIRAAAQASPQPPRIIVSDPALSADIAASLRKAPAVRASVITDQALKRR
jgi:hypothetical protein